MSPFTRCVGEVRLVVGLKRSFTRLLCDRLPEFLLSLKEPDEAMAVDLQSIFQEVCEQASYDLRIDYTQPVPAPALSDKDQTWVEGLITSC